ncbi:calmodulin-like protein [Carpediemonas membranifera]|uniref:Calmodulin-like protein n=1 Tax=Carpediemonas membranifera TaxID=201153 RepID=A0A8J6B1E4_9EUKA|nr:calmodulin-like protein [Carpediemonas membranifera]|eukprot:KAG9396375.1 calmodulin-like protein [Carpediemonas membranifera]
MSKISSTEADLAFKYITRDAKNKKVITVEDLTSAMAPIKPISISEAEKYLHVIPTEPNASKIDKMSTAFTFDRFSEILNLPAIQTVEELNYDPVKEAFSIYTNGEEYLTTERIEEVMTLSGATFTAKDIALLIDALDVDGDGRVGLEDFRAVIKDGDMPLHL